MHVRTWWVWLALSLFVTSWANAQAGKGVAPKTGSKPAPRSLSSNPTVAAAKKLAEESRAGLLKGEDAEAVHEKLKQELLRLANEANPVSDVEAFYEIDYADRLAMLVGAASDKTSREAFLASMKGAPRFANELAMTFSSRDDLEKVTTLAAKLWRLEGKRLDRFATLGAAICVVHDREVTTRANENTVKADDPVKLFGFFADNAERFPLGLEGVPPQLLVYVVDTTAKISELEWALNAYKANRSIGERYFDVQYDYNHFVQGAAKKVTTEGFSLQNILKYGGVCIDQAYFASNVAKSGGIPAAIMRGRSAEVSHAWVAYLQWTPKSATFDTLKGRYPEYRAVMGVVTDPQTGYTVTEAELCLRAALALTPSEKRQRATALEDAGSQLSIKLIPPKKPAESTGEKKDESVEEEEDDAAASAPKLSAEDVKKLLAISEAAVDLSQASVRAWRLGVAVGVNGNWSKAQRDRWGEAILKTMGNGYAAFAIECLIPVIQSADDESQNDLWNWLFAAIKHNGDLASIVRFNQAAMFERRHQPDKAWECYDWILNLYADTCPFSVEAGRRMLALLKTNGKSIGEGADMLGKAWARTKPPRSLNADFAAQSNWYRLGRLYLATLIEAGQKQDAARVAQALGIKL
ncbi:MAG: hypothetical protein U0570_11245 [Phycisphaerales bacterium]